MLPTDIHKSEMCDGFRRNFYKGYHEFALEKYEIPYLEWLWSDKLG